MKYLLLILALLVIAFLLGMKRSTPSAPPPKTKPAAPPPPPKNMVSCAHCGMHLPQDEALPGLGGVFCSAAHRAAHEAAAERGG